MVQPIEGRRRFAGRLLGVGERDIDARAWRAAGCSLPIEDIHKARLAPDDVSARCTMNKEILMVVDAVSNEKGVDKEIIFEALEAALASATRKRHGEDIDVRVAINRKTRRLRHVPPLEGVRGRFDRAGDSRTRELRLEDALEITPDAQLGGFVEVPMESVAFGRIAAQTAKQVIVQKVREAERAQVVTSTRAASARWCRGIVKRVDRNGVFVDLGGNAEGFMPRDQMIPREPVRSQDRIKAFLQDVRSEPRGPQLFLTRTAPEFLIELFKLEVPEVGQGLINILGAARDPGVRAKIAVKSNDSRIDPVGACVGMRGSRVQAVSNEIAGERVDIIPYDENAGAVRHQRDGAGGSRVDRRRRGFALAWTSRWPRRSCRRRSAAAARTSASRAS